MTWAACRSRCTWDGTLPATEILYAWLDSVHFWDERSIVLLLEPVGMKIEITDPKATPARVIVGARMATGSNPHLLVRMQSIVRSTGY